jgi:hypothetical protein
LVKALNRCLASDRITSAGAFRECPLNSLFEAAGAIIVEDVTDVGSSPGLYAKLLAEKGVPVLAALQNKTDIIDDPELLDLAELELREALNGAGYNGDHLPVLRGSAQKLLQHGVSSPIWPELKQALSPFLLMKSGGSQSSESLRSASGDKTMPAVGNETVAAEQSAKEPQRSRWDSFKRLFFH